MQRDYLAATTTIDANPQSAVERLQAVIDIYNDPAGNELAVWSET